MKLIIRLETDEWVYEEHEIIQDYLDQLCGYVPGAISTDFGLATSPVVIFTRVSVSTINSATATASAFRLSTKISDPALIPGVNLNSEPIDYSLNEFNNQLLAEKKN